ncbi:DNA primase family protein [Bacillus sp. FSL R7-0642]|uniref:DNA primase family protein n=1 Tax=Bacillus sp. FSL R7-0642 TaxID=2921585 RepID=UPI0030FC3F1C
MINQSNYLNGYILPDHRDSLNHFVYEVPFFKVALKQGEELTELQLKALVQIIKGIPKQLPAYQTELRRKLTTQQVQVFDEHMSNTPGKTISYELLIEMDFAVTEEELTYSTPWELLKEVQKKYRWSRRGISLGKKDKLQIESNTFAKYVLTRIPLVQLQNSKIYRYNGKGIYEPLPLNVLKTLCRTILNEAGSTLWKRAFETEYIAALERVIPYIQDFDSNPDIINFLNGLFDIKTQQFSDHTPNYPSINQLSYAYDPNAPCPRFIKFLDEIFEGDFERIQIVKEVLGYIWLKDIKIQKAFIFLGKGSNGKSVLAKTIRNLVGAQNLSSTSLETFQSRFGLQELPGKLVNISGENEFSGEFTTEHFKQVTAGDALTVELKHRDSYTTILYVKLVVLLNRMMDSRDTTEAYLRRLLIIPCNRKFVELKQGENPVPGVAYMDLNLEKDLETELPGIFNYSMKGLHELIKNGFKMTSSTICEQALEDYKRSQNPVISFIEDQAQYCENAKILRSSIYNVFTSWCKSNGISGSRIPSRQYMLDELKHQASVKGFILREPKIQGHHFIEGLKLKTQSSVNSIKQVPPAN